MTTSFPTSKSALSLLLSGGSRMSHFPGTAPGACAGRSRGCRYRGPRSETHHHDLTLVLSMALSRSQNLGFV